MIRQGYKLQGHCWYGTFEMIGNITQIQLLKFDVQKQKVNQSEWITYVHKLVYLLYITYIFNISNFV